MLIVLLLRNITKKWNQIDNKPLNTPIALTEALPEKLKHSDIQIALNVTGALF